MRKGFLYLLMSVVTIMSLGTLNSCKDYEEDYSMQFNALAAQDAALRKMLEACHDTCQKNITLLNSKLDALNNHVNDVESELKGDLNTLRSDLNAAITELKEADAAILQTLNETTVNLYAALAELEEKYIEADRVLKAELEGRIAELEGKLAALSAKDAELEALIAALRADLTTVETNLTNQLNTLKTELSEVAQKAGEALTKAENAQKKAEEAYHMADSLGGELDKVKADLEQTQKDLEEAKEIYDAAIALLNQRVDNLEDRVINLEAAVLELKKMYAGQDEAMKEEIAALNDRIDALEERLDKVENSQKALVTSIELNATVNPVFGTFNLPANVRSNLLIGYYGKTVQEGVFPSKSDDGPYVDADKYSISPEAFALLDLADDDKYEYYSNDLLVNGDNELNIGTLYLTVNPTKANFEGTTFDLVNSQDEKALATLSDLKPSDYKIQFGYTRATAPEESKNGFYETKVSIAKADVEAAAIHSEGMANAIQRAVNDFKTSRNINFSDLAVTLLDNLDGVTDAYAVRANWNDELVGERSVYSQYGLAATAMRSLTGYASFKDFNYQTIPGYEQAMGLIDRIASGIKNQIRNAIPDGLKDGFSIDLPEITNVSLNRDDLDLDKFGYSLDITIKFDIDPKDGFAEIVKEGDQAYLQIWAYDSNGELAVVGLIPFGDIKKNADGTYTITIYGGHYADKFEDEMNQILDAIDHAIDITSGNIQEAYDQIEKLVDDVNKMLADLNGIEGTIGDGVDKFASMLQAWLDKINSSIVNLINNSNFFLQPMLVATNASGTRMLSSAPNYATEIPAQTDLILTNFTGEILAPAFKKYVACTNVFKNGASAQGGDSNCTAVLKAVNGGENLNKVLDGSVVRINGVEFQSGYTYELTIAALDYEGEQTARQFYVTVK